MSDLHTLDKTRVARSFNSSAEQYDAVAVLQHTVAERLLERLEVMKLAPKVVIDVGCGTGRAGRRVEKMYRDPLILQLDIAHAMLQVARKGRRRLFSRETYLCGDAEQLPLGNGVADLLYSGLMLQWCNEPARVFREALRVLRPGGLIIFSTFGPDTLMELRESWAEVDDGIHVNNFIDMHDLGEQLVQSGFEQPVMEMERFTLTYRDGITLMRDLKVLGAHNIHPQRRLSLTGKERLQKMLAAYERRRVDGVLPATYEVIYGHAWSPDRPISRAEPGGTATFPLSYLKRR